MNRAVFLDRDGVINHDINYIHKVEDLLILSGVVEGLLALQKEFLLFIVTNQSGIGRGIYKEDQYHVFQNELLKRLENNGVKIIKTYYCPHSPEHKCACRKPHPKFLLEAEKEYGIDLSRSFMIGDRKSDVQAGHNAGTVTVFIESDLNDPSFWLKEPHYSAKNFSDAVKWVLRH